MIGHGTGATRGLFEAATHGSDQASSQVIGNPHNQTLDVAVQWGAAGVGVLYAMWLVHLLLFRGGLATWFGLLFVVQNIFTSLFTRICSIFTRAWMYVLGDRRRRRNGAARRVRRRGRGTFPEVSRHDRWHVRGQISNSGRGTPCESPFLPQPAT